MSKKRIAIAVILLAGVLIIISIGLVISSLEKIAATEFGLKYNPVNKYLDKEVFYEGLYIGVPGFQIINFSAVFRSMQFQDFKCLNEDEIEVELFLSFQYRVRVDSLYDIALFFKDEKGHDSILESVAHAAIHESCSKFNTSQFQTDRGSFQIAVKDSLMRRFDEVYTDLTDLQMQNIQRPEEYEKAIQDKETAREDIDVARQERPKKTTIALNKLKEAKNEADIILQEANSYARVILTKAESTKSIISQQYENEAKVTKDLKISLGFTNEDLIKYLATRAIFSAEKPPIDLAIGQPVQLDLQK